MLSKKAKTQPKSPAILDIVNSQLQRLQEMFQDMLMVSRLDSMNPEDLSFKTIDLNQETQYWSKKYELLSHNKQQHFNLQTASAPAIVDVDAYYMKLAIEHLLENACSVHARKRGNQCATTDKRAVSPSNCI